MSRCVPEFSKSRKRESQSAGGWKHGITDATDIPLTIPLSVTEKSSLHHLKPSMTVEAASPRSRGGGNPLPMVADCKKNFEKQMRCKKYVKE